MEIRGNKRFKKIDTGDKKSNNLLTDKFETMNFDQE